ncbi:putative RNA-binding protein EEED8.10 isoform X2 [Nasonia vitripennis]|uniref:F-box domain-containing protein n=1 Tax=Nasonia vitripennis TaxID=7425 RepID=A0A7M7H5F2_NASVI|nr:putative RNA-binding protein EEED8.10 isoform X2 [Nasonia vitripennis]
MEDRRYSIRKRLREYDVPVEDYIEAGNYRVSPIYKLPDHLFLKIFSYLPLRDRFRIQRVCKFCQKLSIEAWESYNTLTLSLEDWGCDLSFNFPMDKYLVLKNILQVCGPFITCLDLRRSRKCTVWKRIPVDNFHLITIIGEHCPNLLAIDIPLLYNNNSKSIRFLLESAKKLKEWTFRLEEDERFYKEWPLQIPGLNLTNNQCLRKLVIHVPLAASSIWNTLNPQTVEEIDTVFENINDEFCELLKH